MPARILRASLLVAIAAALTGCGGGGGGGGTPAPAPAPPPIVQAPPAPRPPIIAPSYPTLDLTAANAPEALAIALRALGEAPPLSTFAAFVVDLAMGHSPASFGVCPRPTLPTQRTTIFHLDANLAISAGDILLTDFEPCVGSTGTIVIRLTMIDTVAQRFEGRVEFSTQSATGDSIEGSFTLASTFAGAPRVQTLSDLSLVLRLNGEATYITAGRVEMDGPFLAAGYSFSFGGTVASERLSRSYRVDTTFLRGNFSAVPTEGEIVVQGSPAQVRFTPATDPDDRADMANLAIDPAGSGSYGVPTLVPWARMVTEQNVFRWFPNTRPRVTRLEITPPNPTRVDTLVPSYDAVDHDGDPLQFAAFWRRNGTVLPISPELPSGNFVRGDVIELMLQAQDNYGGVGRRTITFTIANAPPVATAAVTPTAPLSIQDLALSSSATDADGDALTTTYAWRVDGAPVPGQTSPTLSHTVHAKNNVVTGVALVNDGFVTTSAEASVTILDSPGSVAVPLPPIDAEYGDTVTFTAVASDYDGDDTSTKDFRIVSGPAGMSVHPDTGVVSWTPHGPLFEPTLRVSYGVSIDELGAGVATGSFVVSDPDHVPPLARGGLSPPTFNGLHVDDLDGDGDLEMLVANDSGIYELQKAAGPGYRQTWANFMSTGGGDLMTGIAAADVDGDHRAEIFAADYSRTIVQYTGNDRKLARRVELPVPSNYVCVDLAVADLDRDGASEAICLAADSSVNPIAATSVIVVLAGDTLAVVAQLSPDVYGGDIAVANVDNDAALEIVTASGHVFDGVAALASISVPQWRYAAGFGWPIAAGDVDGDGIAEIVGLERIEPIPGLGAVNAFDARTRTRRWTFQAPNPGRVHVADVTGDAIAEILVGHDLIGDVTAYRQTGPTTTAELFTVEFGDNASVNVIATGNVDGDADVEIISGGWSNAWFSIAGGSPSPQIEWTFDDGSSLNAFGFLGGERLGADLTYLVGEPDGNLRFAHFDTADGNIAFGGALGTGQLDAAFAVADYDDDGADEALLAAEADNNSETRVLAYDLAGNAVEWSTTGAALEDRPTDVAYADFTGDGRDELVVLTLNGGLRVYRVGTDAPLYERPGVALGGSADVAVVNLDGAGPPEIVATIDNRVVVFSRNATGFEITATSARFAVLTAMEITDVDGDGATDIFVLYGDSGQPARLARLDRFLAQRGETTLGQWATDMTTERSSFARKNLVFWREDFMSEVFAADPTSGAEVWRAPRFYGFIGSDSVRYHDLAGNGDWSIAVGAAPGVTLTR